ncbi:MAG: CYTH and CHAD domain-containing protein [Syntrophales bacterium]
MKIRTIKETEYRFLLPGHETEQAIINYLRAQGCDVQKQRATIQEDIYLDTFDWRLFRRDLSLRLTQSGEKSFYTLKSLGKTRGRRVECPEIECTAVEKTRAPGDISSEKINGEIAEIIYPRRLIGQLAVRTRRQTIRVVDPDATELEIGFDSVSFQTEGIQKHAPCRLLEIVIELKKGESATWAAMAKNIAEKFSLLPSSQSKLVMGIEYLGITFPARNPPRELIVSADDRLDIAVKKILSFQLHRLQENIPGAIADVDTEFVHQARVATRRMRSLLRLFADAVPKSSADYFTGELLLLGSLFGAVRDLDVFSLNIIKFRNDIALAPQKIIELLLRQIQGERASLLANLKEELASTRCRIFFLRLSTFTARKPAIRPLAPLALSKVAQIAPSVIFELLEKAIVLGKLLLLKPKLRNFHKLRIQFKKLRYAAEFFNPAFGGTLSLFIADAVKIQDCLGELQDTVFTRELIVGLLKKWKGSVMEPRLIFILGEMYQLQQEIASARQNEFQEIWKKFDCEETLLKLSKALGTESTPKA